MSSFAKSTLIVLAGTLLLVLGGMVTLVAIPTFQQTAQLDQTVKQPQAHAALMALGADVPSLAYRPLAGSMRLQVSALAQTLTNGHSALRTRYSAWYVSDEVLAGVLTPASGRFARAEMTCVPAGPNFTMGLQYLQAQPGQLAATSLALSPTGTGYPLAPRDVAQTVTAQATAVDSFAEELIPLYPWHPAVYQVQMTPDNLQRSAARVPVWQGGCPAHDLTPAQFARSLTLLDAAGQAREVLGSRVKRTPKTIPVDNGEAWGIEGGKVVLSQPTIGSAQMTWSFGTSQVQASSFYQMLLSNLGQVMGGPTHKMWMHTDGKGIEAQADWGQTGIGTVRAMLEAPGDRWSLSLTWSKVVVPVKAEDTALARNPFASPTADDGGVPSSAK